MPESKKEKFDSASMLTAAKFGTMYGYPTTVVLEAFDTLFKKHLRAKAPAGYLRDIIVARGISHNKESRLQVPIYFADEVLKEIAKNETRKLRRANMVVEK